MWSAMDEWNLADDCWYVPGASAVCVVVAADVAVDCWSVFALASDDAVALVDFLYNLEMGNVDGATSGMRWLG